MAKIPIKQLLDGIKVHGPKALKALKFVKDNGKDIAGGVAAAGAGMKIVHELNERRQENQVNPGKVHYRKARFNEYKLNILKNLGLKKRHELYQYKLEIEQFIKQISIEEKDELVLKKPLHSRRLNNWNDILIQIQDKIKTLDYHEYLKIYHNPDYQSDYFNGFEGHVKKFKSLLDSHNAKDVHQYITEQTGKNIEEIRRDFFI